MRRLREIVQQGPADVIIGKAGVSEGVLREIDRRLREKGVIKVRVLKSALKVSGMDRREIARYVASRVGALLLDVRGRTFVLFRREDYERAVSEGRLKLIGAPSRSQRPRGGGR